ncbi:MAG: hypothetical protein KDE27_02470 [Planctomycetes bacterium]|nr:hypothetical protein [Planctomycetota bacterium]
MSIRCSALASLALFCACGTVDSTPQPVTLAADAAYARPGFVAAAHSGRLYVFRAEDPLFEEFLHSGELHHSVTRVAAGPDGMSVRAPDKDTIDGYLLSRGGFATRCNDGEIWVCPADSPDFGTFCERGTPPANASRAGVGPNGETVSGPSEAAIDAWVAATADTVAQR